MLQMHIPVMNKKASNSDSNAVKDKPQPGKAENESDNTKKENHEHGGDMEPPTEGMIVLFKKSGFSNQASDHRSFVSYLIIVTSYSDHSNHLVTNKLTCHSHLLFQLLTPTSKNFETPGKMKLNGCNVCDYIMASSI